MILICSYLCVFSYIFLVCALKLLRLEITFETWQEMWVLSRKDDQNVRELFDNLSKIKEEFESMQRPSLEVETSNRRADTPSKAAPEITTTTTTTAPQSLKHNAEPITHASTPQTETQKSVRENLRKSLSMAIRQANDSVSFAREESFTSHKILRTKSVDPAAELSKLKMELELENSSRDNPFDEIDDWESDVIVKKSEHGEWVYTILPLPPHTSLLLSSHIFGVFTRG